MRIPEPLIIKNMPQLLGQKIHEDFRLQMADLGFGLPGKIVPDTFGQGGLFLLFQHRSSNV